MKTLGNTDLLPQRFWDKVKRNPETFCWEWTAAKHKYGYGAFGWKGKTKTAHSMTYVAFFGPVPDGLELDHLCRNPACCNPTHLEAVTHKENIRRGRSRDAWQKGQAAGAAYQRSKTHCPRGHPYSGTNLYTAPSGGRHCRKCMNKYTKRWQAAQTKSKRKAKGSGD